MIELKSNRLKLHPHRLLLCFLMLFQFHHAQFTPGRLVVLQAGDGNSPLSGTGNPMFLKEFSTSGSPGFSLTVPSTGTNALIIRGSASSEAYLSLSEDANFLVFGGYAKSLPNSTTLNSAVASNIPRGIGLADASGNFFIGAIGNTSFANGDLRAACGTGSANLWSSSSSNGTAYYGPAASQGNVQNSKTNLRAVTVFNGQLYISSQVSSGSPSVIGVYAVGSGTPVTGSQTVSLVINTGSNSLPGQFYFNAANTICYIADANNSASGGIQKWVKSSSTWSLAYTLATGTTAVGAFGVVADFSGSNPKIYATTCESSNNRLIAIRDTGPASTATTLATASGANTIFRGLAFSPGTVPCNSPVILGTSNNAPVCSQSALVFSTTINGTSPFTYTWSGYGVFSSTAVPNPSISNSQTGNYTLQVGNSCGISSTVIAVNILPSPTLQINSPTICAGGNALLLANGALTYTWSNGSNSNSISVSPQSTSVYTVIGTSSQFCSSSPVTGTVVVTSALSLSVNSATLCSGNTTSLIVSGAGSYTWSNGSNSPTLVIQPNTMTVYSVTGTASGCPNPASITVTVQVNSLPGVSLTIPSSTFCLQENALPFATIPPGGILSGNGINVSVFSPSLAGIGTHTIHYLYTDSNSCVNTASLLLQVFACTDLEETKIDHKPEVYPNPVHQVLCLKYLPANSLIRIRIMDGFGKVCYDAVHENIQMEIPVHHLNSGFYYLLLTFSEHQYLAKFVKD